MRNSHVDAWGKGRPEEDSATALGENKGPVPLAARSRWREELCDGRLGFRLWTHGSLLGFGDLHVRERGFIAKNNLN